MAITMDTIISHRIKGIQREKKLAHLLADASKKSAKKSASR